jgi:hypothetical protein
LKSDNFYRKAIIGKAIIGKAIIGKAIIGKAIIGKAIIFTCEIIINNLTCEIITFISARNLYKIKALYFI